MKVSDLVRKKTTQAWFPGGKPDNYGIGLIVSIEYALRHQVGGFPRSVKDVVVLWPKHGIKQEMHERLEVVVRANKEKK